MKPNQFNEMKRTFLLVFALLSISMLSKAQASDILTKGKPFMKIFTNYHSVFNQGESANGFALTRFYFGYEYTFNEHWYVKANIDVGDPGFGKYDMVAYVKNAYFRYSIDKFSVNFGMISTTQFKVQEDFWGYRYLLKSFQDAYRYNSSADLGVSVKYEFNKYVSADIILANGDGYQKLESDSVLRTGLGVTLTPVKNLTVRVYYDYSQKQIAQQSIATFLGYATEKFSLGAEYNKQLNPGFNDDRQLNGISVYGTVVASKKFKFFARYDALSSNVEPGEDNFWNISRDGQLYIAGIEFTPIRGVKLAPNFKGWQPTETSQGFISSIMLNCEIKF